MHQNAIRSFIVSIVFLSFIGNAHADFTTSDLQGIWKGHSISSGSEEVWGRSISTLNAEGNITSWREESDGSYDEWQGAISITSDGIIKPEGGPNYEGIMSLNKDIIIFSDSWTNNSNELGVVLKTGGDFTNPDLTGEWKIYQFTTGLRKVWERSEVSIDSEGILVGSHIDSNGKSGTFSVKVILNEDGSIQQEGAPELDGLMRLTKDLFVFTTSWDNGNTNVLGIGMKAGGRYSQSDLQGTWKIHRLESGMGEYDWNRLTITVDATGKFMGNSFDSRGRSNQTVGSLIISDDGIIQADGTGAAYFHAFTNLGKDVIVATETEDDGAVAIAIGTKVLTSSSPGDGDSPGGGGGSGGGGGGGCFITSLMR
jgi:hypothetical protein